MSILTCIIIASIQSCIAVVLICVFQWLADKRFQAIVAKRNEKEYDLEYADWHYARQDDRSATEAAEEAAAKDRAAEQAEQAEEEKAVITAHRDSAWPRPTAAQDAEFFGWWKARMENPNHPY